MQDLRTHLRKEIEDLIKRHPGGLTHAQLMERTGANSHQVHSVVGRLRDKLFIRAVRPGRPHTPYVWAESNMNDVPTPSNAINKMEGQYTCPELKPFTGRPNCNDHMKWPSLQGKTRVWPDGRREGA